MGAPVTISPGCWHVIGELELAGMLADHARIRRLCDRLEAIADGLPDPPDPATVSDCCREIEALPQHHASEQRLFDWLFGRAANADLFRRLMGRIVSSHLIDQVHAEDLTSALRASDDAATPGSANELGYMLRCFFDGCRRALAFEELTLLTLGDKRLTPGARDALTASLAGRGSPFEANGR